MQKKHLAVLGSKSLSPLGEMAYVFYGWILGHTPIYGVSQIIRLCEKGSISQK